MADGNSSKQSDLPRGLIGRRGLPMGRGARLPSMGKPRDLTLGGIPKKVFTPNIPVRKEKNQGSEQSEKQIKKETKEEKKTRESNRGRGRGRGRGQDVIQSHSIFEQGPNEKTINRGYSYSEGVGGGVSKSGGGTERSSGSKLSVKKEKTDMETKQALDYLLRDDFIDDKNSNDLNMDPVQLPLCKMEVAHTKDEKKDIVNKMDEGGLSDKSVVVGQKLEALKTPKTMPHTGASDLFSLLSKAEPEELLFFQFPDAMPGIPAFSGEDDRSKTKTDNKKEEDLSKKLGACSLSDFSEGHMGKMVIRKSGKTQLILGNVVLDVNMGPNTPGGLQYKEFLSLPSDPDRGLIHPEDIAIEENVENISDQMELRWQRFLKRIQDGDWGGSVELQGLSQMFDVPINVLRLNENQDDLLQYNFNSGLDNYQNPPIWLGRISLEGKGFHFVALLPVELLTTRASDGSE